MTPPSGGARLDSVSRSPIYSHFAETLAGAVTTGFGRIVVSEREVRHL
jgi:hypothetical protein